MARVEASYLQDGYAGKGRGLTGWYRDLTVAEVKAGKHGSTLYAVDRSGRVRECRVNGMAKTWKRSPGATIALKYGLKECFTVGGKESLPHEPIGSAYGVRIVVPVVGPENTPFPADLPPGIVSDWVKDQLGIS